MKGDFLAPGSLTPNLTISAPGMVSPWFFTPFTFVFFCEYKLVARKEERCAEKASAGKEIQPRIRPCFRRLRRARRAPGRAPLQRT